jgi:hypothetical protein
MRAGACVLTARLRDCALAIDHHWRAFGEAPTRTELGCRLGITGVSAHLLVRRLQAKGLANVCPRVHRNVELTDVGQAALRGKPAGFERDAAAPSADGTFGRRDSGHDHPLAAVNSRPAVWHDLRI